MIIFIMRRLLLLLITLFFLSIVAFSLSYFTPNAPLRGASLWDAYQFYFTGLMQFDFGVSSINGGNISTQLKAVFPPPWNCAYWPSHLLCSWGSRLGSPPV